MNKLIGLTGPARSGKDTVADILIERKRFKESRHKIAFADPIKDLLTQLIYWKVIDRSLDDFEKEAPIRDFYDVSPRQLMQTLGTEWGRNMIHEDIWLEIVKTRIDNLTDYEYPNTHVIITDVRFQNEADYVRQHGELWHVSRDSAQAVRAHSSENGIPFDVKDKIIENNGTLEELQEKVIALWASYRN